MTRRQEPSSWLESSQERDLTVEQFNTALLYKQLLEHPGWKAFETHCRERQSNCITAAIEGDNTNQRMRQLDMAKGISEALGAPARYRAALSDLCSITWGRTLEEIEAAAETLTAESVHAAAVMSETGEEDNG